jgi:vacuolar iron transporter family protein
MPTRSHPERHRTHRAGWLRAAVLGANDGIVSTASLLVGVAAAGAGHEAFWWPASPAWWPAPCPWRPASTCRSAPRPTSSATTWREAREQRDNPEYEHAELAAIYRNRGLDAALADQVARQLMDHDALGAHARDELGISRTVRARPTLAALASAATFSRARRCR